MTATQQLAQVISKSRIKVLLQPKVNDFATLMKWMVLRPIETFYKNGAIQCRAGKNRSITDICIAARDNLGYSVEETMPQLARWIFDNYKNIHIFYCPNIRKVVFCKLTFPHTKARWDWSLQYMLNCINSRQYAPRLYNKSQLITKNALIENLLKMK